MARLPLVFLCLGSFSPVNATEGLTFNRDIRPLLADNCFHCHGPDPGTRKAGLRLDTETGFFASRQSKNGKVEPPTVIKGSPDKSSLFQRIVSKGEDEVMPPPESHKKLKPEQIERVKAWIEQGAPWQPHWSLLAPVAVTPPADPTGWAKNPIDCFVLAKLKTAGLDPAPEAEPRALIRRLSLDVAGLPPSPELLAKHLPKDGRRLSDTQVLALVDELMATPAYGEHRARYWLDAARYGDSHGVHVDYPREMWPYRDWVTKAFNANQRFDEFTIEQIAGDLLPDPTEAQRIATGLQRCNVTTNEGGTIVEEALANYAADRVQTMGWVYFGLTMNCAQCHDHKFDPFTTKDFYSMAAFFRNTTQSGLDGNARDGASSVLYLPAAADQALWKRLPGEVAAAETALKKAKVEAAADLKKAQAGGGPWVTMKLDQYLAEHRPDIAELAKQTKVLQDALTALRDRTPLTHVQEERKGSMPMAHILIRGAYDKKGEQVAAEIPSALGKLPDGWPKNRLGLARWLVSEANPLTARVTVNRMWQEIFGQGLVKTSEDFGIMGAPPTHPELLDWLAVEFRRTGWDVKNFYRLVLTSATYRQATFFTPEKSEKDRDNSLLSRGPRFRMDAEMIRDQALAVSGALSPRIGGPPVKPYQPEGVWDVVNHSPPLFQNYVVGKGEELYRRSLYSYWRRLAPPANLDLFDAPSRQVSCVRRDRTNTPLQALTTLNDTQFVEAARLLAQRILSRPADDRTRVQWAAERALARPLDETELTVVLGSLGKLRSTFGQRPLQAQALLKVGDHPAAEGVPAPELAAWTMVCSELLNLDEALNK